MYNFNLLEQQALQKLPNDAARLAIQRWAELTHDATHPEWKCKPMLTPAASIAPKLISTIQKDHIDQVSSLVQLVSARMLYVDGSARRWQHNTVRGFLLDPDGSYETKLKMDLIGRLETLLGLRTAEVPDETKKVTLSWPIEPRLRATTQAPWKNPALGPFETERPKIILTERKVDEGRQWKIETEIIGDYPLRVDRLGAYLRAEGSIVLDFLRLAYPDQELRVSVRMDASVDVGEPRLKYVRASAFPRLLSRERARQALGNAFNQMNGHPSSDVTHRLMGAARWMSTSVSHWHENPVFASGMLWMALDAMFGGCVIQHEGGKSKHKAHMTALDLYVHTLRDRLASEVESYILAMRGTKKDRERSLRKPPAWTLGWVSRGGLTVDEWLQKILRLMAAERSQDPLLAERCKELLILSTDRLEEIRKQRKVDLEKLYKIRNFMAHKGNIIAQENVSDYLAALACETLFCGFEHPERLIQ